MIVQGVGVSSQASVHSLVVTRPRPQEVPGRRKRTSKTWLGGDANPTSARAIVNLPEGGVTGDLQEPSWTPD
jgi:hypothetical protein